MPDPHKLIEYEEIDYFVSEFAKMVQRKDTTKRINDIENLRWAQSSMHKKGAQAYQQQQLNWLDVLKEQIEDKKETVFSRLRKKKKAKSKPLTVFEKLRLEKG